MKLNFFSNKNYQTTTPPTPSQKKGERITKETQKLYQSTGWTLNQMTPFLIKMKTCEKFLFKMWLSSNTSNISIKYLLHRKMISPILFQTIRLCSSYAFEANLDQLKGQTGISILFIFININIKMHASPMLLICTSLNRIGVCNKIPSLKDIYHREFVK